MSRELHIKAYIKAIAESQTAWRHGRERNGPHLGLWPWTQDEGSCNRVYMPQFGLYLSQTVLYGGLWKGRETLTYKGPRSPSQALNSPGSGPLRRRKLRPCSGQSWSWPIERPWSVCSYS